MRRPRGIDVLRRWWTAKYRLPSSHPSFGEWSFGELLQERYEDLYVELQDVSAAIGEATNSGEMQALSDRLAEIQKALREPLEVDTGDALIDEWERDIAEGRAPDLMKGWRKG